MAVKYDSATQIKGGMSLLSANILFIAPRCSSQCAYYTPTQYDMTTLRYVQLIDLLVRPEGLEPPTY